MVKVKKGDFIELEYIGKFSNGNIFDTNNPEEAKKIGFEGEVKPLTINVGEKQVIQGLDAALVDKEVGKKESVEIPQELGYGKKDPKLIKIVKADIFRQNKMNPVPGMQVNADGRAGTVRSVTGGRVTVDFNHPLAGRNLVFEFKVLKIVTDEKIKLKNIIDTTLFLNEKMYDFKIDNEKIIFECTVDIPKPLQQMFEDKVKKVLPKFKEIEFKKKSTTQE